MREWLYNEKKHCGVDYAARTVARRYDEAHGQFRDYQKETGLVIEALRLSKDDTVVDLGCGTGAFALNVAPHCKKVIGVDISAGMLAVFNDKVRELDITNIETVCAGFLTYAHQGAPADAVVSMIALHHLPDFWKLVALRRIKDLLKPGGRFCLFDVVFSFPLEAYEEYFDRWVGQMRDGATSQIGEEVVIHLRDEYSTTEKIMDGLLAEAGFTIEHKTIESPYTMWYVCVKTEN